MEALITNLNPQQFPVTALGQLHAMRWGIETSFQGLKYAVGLIHLHAKKPELVLQKIFASSLIYNFTQATTRSVDAFIFFRRNLLRLILLLFFFYSIPDCPFGAS